MKRGTEIDYRIRIRGISVRWQNKITVWDLPQRFVDEQIRGPYRVRIHEHRFAEKPQGILCEDSVQDAPLGGALVNKRLVERDIRKMFTYRSERLWLLGSPQVAAELDFENIKELYCDYVEDISTALDPARGTNT
jgi:ligand-binding SRPBCC domain-containing protein